GIDALKEAGLLDLEPVEFRGDRISPREFFLVLAEPKLRPLPGDTDVCVMWNTASVEKDGQEIRADYYMWAPADKAYGMSAMSRVTGSSAAIGARMLGRGEIKQKGIIPPEDAIRGKLYERFIDELKERGIRIFEVTSVKPLPV
ncbi:MAG TPA: saccharopine dehydrogenase C-terminal domain-containing protein, partial [Methanotrichaceae archaeon]|nr:saccharopine dehydrogenase C-terminal domain-containing protein [Methanotrichaceae archaeon]